jgi:ribosomal protein L29
MSHGDPHVRAMMRALKSVKSAHTHLGHLPNEPAVDQLRERLARIRTILALRIESSR